MKSENRFVDVQEFEGVWKGITGVGNKYGVSVGTNTSYKGGFLPVIHKN